MSEEEAVCGSFLFALRLIDIVEHSPEHRFQFG